MTDWLWRLIGERLFRFVQGNQKNVPCLLSPTFFYYSCQTSSSSRCAAGVWPWFVVLSGASAYCKVVVVPCHQLLVFVRKLRSTSFVTTNANMIHICWSMTRSSMILCRTTLIVHYSHSNSVNKRCQFILKRPWRLLCRHTHELPMQSFGDPTGYIRGTNFLSLFRCR